MSEEIKLTEKGTKVVGILQQAGITNVDKALFAKEISDKDFHLSPASVPGILTGLAKKGLIGKTEDSPRKYYLTELGANISL